MIKIKEFKDYNLKVTWKLLYLGFRGDTLFKDQFSANDILDYAIEQLESENCDKLVYELANEQESDSEEISKLLEKLSINENLNELELRKLRAVIMLKHLAVKNKNFINGLMELGDLYIQLNFPKDSPHIIQGRNNNITPDQYYTKENYDNLYKKHLLWLKNEIKFIQQNQ